jgi:hypothetical protein
MQEAQSRRGVPGLDQRVTELFRRIVALWDGTIRPQPFEKVVSENSSPWDLLFPVWIS